MQRSTDRLRRFARALPRAGAVTGCPDWKSEDATARASILGCATSADLVPFRSAAALVRMIRDITAFGMRRRPSVSCRQLHRVLPSKARQNLKIESTGPRQLSSTSSGLPNELCVLIGDKATTRLSNCEMRDTPLHERGTRMDHAA
jgi:hypothetical protein